MDVMKENIETAGRKMRTISSCALTHREAIELIAPPEHVETLFAAADIADVPSRDSTAVEIPFDLDDVARPSVTFLFRAALGKRNPLLPRYRDWYSFGCEDVAQRVLKHIEYLLVCARMERTCAFVLDELNENCRDGFQIRALWPVVQLLCDEGQYTSKDYRAGYQLAANWRERHAVVKRHQSMPRVDPAFRKVLQETAAWVTQSRLLEPDAHQKDAPEPEAEPRVSRCYDFNCTNMAGDASMLLTRGTG
jgi:hypothetical protein